MNEIYLSTSKATYTFDVERGLVDSVTTESTQKYGIDGNGSGAVQLKEVRRQRLEWIEDFAIEATAFDSTRSD